MEKVEWLNYFYLKKTNVNICILTFILHNTICFMNDMPMINTNLKNR